MKYAFYDSAKYKREQAERTSMNIGNGLYEHLKKREDRRCIRLECSSAFQTWPSNPKKFCGSSCAAIFNNSKRALSLETRQKIALSMTGKINQQKGTFLVPRSITLCTNPRCGKEFLHERTKDRKYCSIHCAITSIGSSPTSAKASRGKSGTRSDIDLVSNFHSRWEANMARWFNFLRVEWAYEPKSFDIGNQMYTPDFYLPEFDTYVEVKNFWNEYASTRDSKFRKNFPELKLDVILKKEYEKIQGLFSEFIPAWEYNNGPIPVVELTSSSSWSHLSTSPWLWQRSPSGNSI